MKRFTALMMIGDVARTLGMTTAGVRWYAFVEAGARQDRESLETLMRACREPHDRPADTLLDDWKLLAESLVAQHWKVIQQIAKALLKSKYGMLRASAIHQIWESEVRGATRDTVKRICEKPRERNAHLRIRTDGAAEGAHHDPRG